MLAGMLLPVVDRKVIMTLAVRLSIALASAGSAMLNSRWLETKGALPGTPPMK